MWKPSSNPTVHELTKTTRARRINLSDLKPVLGPEGKSCIWCLSPLRGAQRKWCSPLCSNSAFAWANPQSEEGLSVLLARQGYKCADPTCQYDWNPLADSLLGTRGIPKDLDRLSVTNIRLLKGLKRLSPKGTKPEVDHITPFALGGQGIGFDNHQVICYSSHKAKTKIQNSGPRKKGTVHGN